MSGQQTQQMDIGRRIRYRPSAGIIRLRIWRSAHQIRKVLAIGLLLCAALLVAVPSRVSTMTAPHAESVTVVVAVSAIDAGAVLSADLIAEREIPAQLVPDGAQVRAADLLGLHSLGPIKAGEILTDARLLEHSDSAYSARPAGTVPILLRVSDPAVIASLSIGACVDIYAGEPSTPLTKVSTGASVIALSQPALSEGVPGTSSPPNARSSSSSGYIVIAVMNSAAEKVANSTSSSIIFATFCGG